MAPSKLRKAIGAVKDRTSISLAKVGGGASISDLDVAIVKATRHDEYPPEEKHVEDILILTINNSRYVEACINTISKRLNKTRDWVVAIKALMLVNRLLNDGDRAFAEAVFYTTRRETRLLDMAWFKDARSDYHDYSAFVRNYALYVDAKVKFGHSPGNAKRGSVVHNLIAYPKDEIEPFPSPTRGRTVYRLTERKNNLSPRRGTRRYEPCEDRDRKNSPSPVKAMTGADKEDSPYSLMTTPRYGRRNSPSPTRARPRGVRGKSSSLARATPRHDKKNSPSPVRGRSRPQSPVRVTPRHDRGYGPSPRRGRTRGARNVSPPTRALVRHDMNRSPKTPIRDGMDSPPRGARHDRKTSTSPDRGTPMCDRSTEELFSRMKRLVHLLDRFLACQPTGMAKTHRIVFAALCQLVKESFRVYIHITELMSIFVERFDSFDIIQSVEAYKIFQHVANQFYELYKFYGWCDSIGIARQYDYPDVHQISPEKLESMEEYIRDKTASNPKKETNENEDSKSEIIEEDMNAIKSLPPPEGFEEEPEEQKEEDVKQHEETQKEADLLGLGESTIKVEDYGEKLALALFDGATPETEPWEAFKDTENWETTLVQSTSYLANQKASFGGGFDTMLLNGMYQHGVATQAANAAGYGLSGSHSSVALGSSGKPMALALALALPPPPGAMGSGPGLTAIDPFAASLNVPPPSYVQMSELENKQKLLVQEQLMWQQFSREGMQGQVGLPTMQPNPFTYNVGGYYTNTY